VCVCQVSFAKIMVKASFAFAPRLGWLGRQLDGCRIDNEAAYKLLECILADIYANSGCKLMQPLAAGVWMPQNTTTHVSTSDGTCQTEVELLEPMFERMSKLTAGAVTTVMLEQIEDVKKENAKLETEVTNMKAQLEQLHEERSKWKKEAELRTDTNQKMYEDICLFRKEKKTMQKEMEKKDEYIAELEGSITGDISDGPVDSSDGEEGDNSKSPVVSRDATEGTLSDIAALLKSKREYTECSLVGR